MGFVSIALCIRRGVSHPIPLVRSPSRDCRENILPNPKRRTRSVDPSHPLPPSATSPHLFSPTLSLRSSHDMALTLVTILLFYFIFIDRAAVPFPLPVPSPSSPFSFFVLLPPPPPSISLPPPASALQLSHPMVPVPSVRVEIQRLSGIGLCSFNRGLDVGIDWTISGQLLGVDTSAAFGERNVMLVLGCT